MSAVPTIHGQAAPIIHIFFIRTYQKTYNTRNTDR